MLQHPAPTVTSRFSCACCVPLGYDWPVSNQARYEVNRPDVVDESVDGEVLIVHLGTGVYYSSRNAGDVVWQLLASGATVSEAASVAGQTEPAVKEFLARLVDDDLLRARDGAAGPLPQVGPHDGALVLEKYTDMTELLLLDPIHDVEEEGWPKARAGAPES